VLFSCSSDEHSCTQRLSLKLKWMNSLMLAVQLLRACEFFPVIACQGFPWFVPFSARCVFFSSRASETFETVSPCRRTKVFTHTTCFFLLLLFCRFPDLISTFLSKIVLKWDFLIVWFGLFVMSYGFLCCWVFFLHQGISAGLMGCKQSHLLQNH